MAIPIKQVPILSGQIAEEFMRTAEENELRPRRQLTISQDSRIQRIMKELRENNLPWDKQ